MYDNQHRWKRVKVEDEVTVYEGNERKVIKEYHIETEYDEHGDPKPLDTEDGKVAYRVLLGYDEAIKVLEEQISQLKQKILHE
jgi:hypothetical protein